MLESCSSMAREEGSPETFRCRHLIRLACVERGDELGFISCNGLGVTKILESSLLDQEVQIA